MTTPLYQDLGMTVFLAQPSLESQVGYLRFRFLTLNLSNLSSALLCYTKKIFFFFTLNPRFLTVWFFYLTDKTHVPALNYLLRSQIFVNNDGQLRVTHLILDYKPISRTFLDVGNSIRANDYRLAHTDVSRPGFLAPHDLPPVDHPIP